MFLFVFVSVPYCMFSQYIEYNSITSYLDTIQITLILRSHFDAHRTPKFLFGLVQGILKKIHKKISTCLIIKKVSHAFSR